ncbi:MAG TPA: tRNA (adenosine(37)-N6)-threonylcarbamoyltransferase complex ATPase subunit type 1 TsaE [Cyanobacteria bacterium UBA8156]|jgi:tRNA threonylcarbamoyladenosine biosynthesis protein TsaE|nr:tRNA (adenosine(37)-N6)-threonylcarbamoyltransferase complex ATPase subunit type 1 TsaE [Cyanobacteria bacterium UBA8156]
MAATVCLSLGSAPALQKVAERLAVALFPGSVLCLSGDLGVGKTTFVQGLGRGLGCPTAPTSPTFSLIDEHLGGRLPLYHVDLYRLTPEQVPALHLEAYLSAQEFPPGVLAVEWPERLPRPFAECLYLRLALDETDRDGRSLTVESWGDRHGALLLDWLSP